MSMVTSGGTQGVPGEVWYWVTYVDGFRERLTFHAVKKWLEEPLLGVNVNDNTGDGSNGDGSSGGGDGGGDGGCGGDPSNSINASADTTAGTRPPSSGAGHNGDCSVGSNDTGWVLATAADIAKGLPAGWKVRCVTRTSGAEQHYKYKY
jgi:hypothetical protein